MSESLTQEQFEWMREQHDYIDLAFRWREAQTIRDLADGDYYKSVFGDMNFADAYQSYEDMLAKNGSETKSEPKTLPEATADFRWAAIALWDAVVENLRIEALARWIVKRTKGRV